MDGDGCENGHRGGRWVNPVRLGVVDQEEAARMLRWRARSKTCDDSPFGVEYVPGLGAVTNLNEAARWRLAGEYSVTHQLTGPWYRRACVRCGTRGGCEFGRWADGVLTAKARRDWLGQ